MWPIERFYKPFPDNSSVSPLSLLRCSSPSFPLPPRAYSSAQVISDRNKLGAMGPSVFDLEKGKASGGGVGARHGGGCVDSNHVTLKGQTMYDSDISQDSNDSGGFRGAGVRKHSAHGSGNRNGGSHGLMSDGAGEKIARASKTDLKPTPLVPLSWGMIIHVHV